MIWLHRYSVLLAAATLLLIAAGGMVTSTNAGLSVPDWPTTYGHNMFLYPLDQMQGGIFYEHGHRLIASGVGLLTIGLVLLQWRFEPRRGLRRLGFIALVAVIAQGTLGGLTVLYRLPDVISISHAGLAQLFFCMTATIALLTSSGWLTPGVAPVDDSRLRRRGLMLTGLVYCQILLGATMRHTGAGLVIPDFPLSFGHVVPPFWNTAIGLHFAHRVGALIVTGAVIATAGDIWSRHRTRRELARPATALLLLVATQVTLGALVILTAKHPLINTMHVATGALVLVTSLIVTLRSFRVRFGRHAS